MNEAMCEYMFPHTSAFCEKTATVFADVVVDGVQILGFRCDQHEATPDDVDVMLARAKQAQHVGC